MIELEALQSAWAQHVEMENRRGPKTPHPYVYASARRKCLRRMVLECTEPNAFPEFDVEAKARLARGNQRERDISIDLMRVGRLCVPKFEFIGQQEHIRITDRAGRLIISGKIDGYIRWESGAKWPTEIKSWSPFLTDRIFSFEDLYRNPYTWSGAHQLLSYLYEKNAPYGLLILDRPGLPRLIQVSLEDNLDAMEDFLLDATVAVDHILSETLPEYSTDPAECRKCPAFGAVCNPPLDHGRGGDIITDEELLLKLERHQELQAASREYDTLDKDIKDRLRGIELGIAGPFLLEGKFSRTVRFDVPVEVKKQYEKVDPKGMFRLKITRVQGGKDA